MAGGEASSRGNGSSSSARRKFRFKKPGDFRREQARPVASARSVLRYASTLDAGIAPLSAKSARFLHGVRAHRRPLPMTRSNGWELFERKGGSKSAGAL